MSSKKGLRKDDFVARVGGDEFVAILDVDKADILRKTVRRIEENVKNFNQHSHKPYQISFSIGFDIYDNQKKRNLDDFFGHVDDLMYKNKREKDDAQGASCLTHGKDR